MARLSYFGWLVVASAPFIAAGFGPQTKPIPTYEADIKPLIKAHCASCHSGAGAMAGFDATTYKGILTSVIAGDPEKSTLVLRLKGTNGLPIMPQGAKPLEPEKIRLVEDWIRAGAPEGAQKAHWAYVPVRKPEPPRSDSTWVRNPIDAFVLARLRQEGLQPSPEAAPETLVRRLSLDLNGLPPTIAEVDRYAASKESYGALVDRLLKSPRYGERMAIPWLDLARYADSDGYEKDGMRTAWMYRDWVIDAFNRNVPYDQFTIEQLAGDLLPKATLRQRIATGFNRNSMLNLEGGVDQEEAMFEVRNDRVATTSQTWLGQTLACARCHDHKYDPISHKDYYRFYAFFANNLIDKRGDPNISEQKYVEPSIPAPTEEQSKALAILDSKTKTAASALERRAQAVEKELAEWATLAASDPFQRISAIPKGLGLRLEGTTIVAEGKGPATGTYEVAFDAPTGTRAIAIDALPDTGRPNNGPGRASSGNFILSKVAVPGARVIRAKADYVQGGYSETGLLDEDGETGWAVAGAYGKPHRLVIELDKTISGKTTLRLDFGSKQWPEHTLARFAVGVSGVEGGARFALPELVAKAIAESSPTHQQRKVVTDYFASVALSNRAGREALANLQAERAKLQSAIPTAQVMVEADGKPEAPLRHRGEFISPREMLSSGTPPAFGPAVEGSRLDLAKWTVDPKNPLTARVQVNRIWEMLFGRGLVETSENFGTQGAKPSHPELLDWLAATYVETGWDTKRLIKLIVSSATYRQTSATTKERFDKDPYNALLSRGPRFRLPAELVRDSALAASGILNEKLGGPPVFPYQPEGVWDSPYSGERWVQSDKPNALRRSVYTFWKRTAPYPSFMAFDATSRETCTVRRVRTNTPLQALATLNDPAMFEAARLLGERYGSGKASLEQRVTNAFRAVVSRKPTTGELQRLITYWKETSSKKGERTAWTMLGNVLLNLDEAMTKE